MPVTPFNQTPHDDDNVAANGTNGMKNALAKIFNNSRSRSRNGETPHQDRVKEKNAEVIGNEPCDFETAITETGFGKFNLLLILLAIPSGWSSMFETTTMSYVIPVAHCDLSLTLEEKGLLISITYLGMLSSAIIWGFLSDTLGRKKLMIIGYLADGFFMVVAGISQSLPMIAFAKFMGGFIINGPFAVLTTVLSEFHCAKYRARVLLFMGIVFSLANIILPLLGLALLSQPINWFLGETFVIHSWNVFILVSGLPSLVSGVGHMFMPESPKFLMTAGKNEEALRVLRMVYSMNTGKSPDSYPVKILIDETKDNEDYGKRSKWVAFKDGFAQMKPLFFPPHLMKIVLVCIIQIGSMMGLNTLRLWLPQFFTAINDYQANHNDADASMCEMLEMVRPNTSVEAVACTVNYDNASVYTNSMIVAMTSILGYILVGTLINALGKKNLFVCLGVVAGACGFCIYLTNDSAGAIALSSIYTSLCGINTNVILTIVVDLFPTSLRTMAVAIVMMCGRSGAMLGNVIFPHMIAAGCLPPFLFIALSTIACSLIAILLPKTDMKALE